ncbi:MAG: hypothetical protein B7Z08_08375 [Sphingomonadales bacterium 32-68-7]|nr:MAG: hypothetical protein B7Z33_10165 [Sphingomonadales bacterium 12-68-11]OYX08721.1 MAG: hypothetical protein B7Z08_08375 [Sphingomonadales bacterium 32-68-7]
MAAVLVRAGRWRRDAARRARRPAHSGVRFRRAALSGRAPAQGDGRGRRSGAIAARSRPCG